MKHYLVVNLGLRSIRTILYDEVGLVCDEDWYPIQTTISGDAVEQNADEWWGLLRLLLRQLFAKNSNYQKNIKSITVTASASCLVALDGKGNPVTPVMMVSDKRAAQQLEQLKKNPALKKIFRIQLYAQSPSFMPPKIVWMRHNKPASYKKTKYFMGASDFLIYKLTNKIYTDALSADKFYYNKQKKIYYHELLETLGISAEQLPHVCEVGEQIGVLKEELKQEFGVKNDVSVFITTYDALCAALGSGANRDGDLCMVGGTVGSVRIIAKQKPKHLSPLVSVYTVLNYHLIGGSNNLDGGIIEWAKNALYEDSRNENSIYAIMQEEARLSPAGSRGVLFLPYLLGERFPFVNGHVRGMFIGLERYHTRYDMMRAVFEASALVAKSMVDYIVAGSRIEVRRIFFSGGLAQCDIESEIRAHVLQKQIIVFDDIESTSRGAYNIMMVATGTYRELSQIPGPLTRKCFKPNTSLGSVYKKLYEFFLDSLSCLEIFDNKHYRSLKQSSSSGQILDNL